MSCQQFNRARNNVETCDCVLEDFVQQNRNVPFCDKSLICFFFGGLVNIQGVSEFQTHNLGTGAVSSVIKQRSLQ